MSFAGCVTGERRNIRRHAAFRHRLIRCIMANRDLVVIGGSAGAIPPLQQILGGLPADLPAAIVVVLHIPSNSTGIFVTVASASTHLPVKHAEDGAEIENGVVYLAPPDWHLLVLDGHFKLGNGPRENLVRPSIDPLFRSAALSAGPRTVGVILSGLLNDGASGLAAIKSCGGIALVQSPSDAIASDMPLAALEASSVDLSDTAEALAGAVDRFVRGEPSAARPGPPGLKLEIEIAAGGPIGTKKLTEYATPIAITCPDCGGVLSEMHDKHPLRFRCQVGHAYSAQSLLSEQEGHVDEAMRVALRIIEERAELVERMGRDAGRVGRQGMADMYQGRAAEYRGYADSLREAVLIRMDAKTPNGEEERLTAAEVRGSGDLDEI